MDYYKMGITALQGEWYPCSLPPWEASVEENTTKVLENKIKYHQIPTWLIDNFARIRNSIPLVIEYEHVAAIYYR
jgi:hypothetical protein